VWSGRQTKVHVVGDDQIEPSVAIVIYESAAGTPRFAGTRGPRRFAHFFESSVFVVIKAILAVVSNVEVLPAVIVVVPHAYSLPPSARCKPGLHSHVGKSAVVIIAIEMVRRRLARRKSLEGCAVDDENVRPPVVVEIKNCYARSSCFNDVLLCIYPAEDVHHGETGLVGDVLEVRKSRWLLGMSQARRHNQDAKKCCRCARSTEGLRKGGPHLNGKYYNYDAKWPENQNGMRMILQLIVHCGGLRNATSSLPTGTPRTTFTRSTASKGFISPFSETLSLSSSCSRESSRDTYSAAACVPMVVVPARISTDRAGFNPGTNPMTAKSSVKVVPGAEGRNTLGSSGCGRRLTSDKSPFRGPDETL